MGPGAEEGLEDAMGVLVKAGLGRKGDEEAVETMSRTTSRGGIR